ncbi:hypothetical protein [Bradyrhizobium sp. 33ap4]|uniref:hypothetical protein n=1 Tax=Bradyrhizobium sp. 33ap4 TaxID=3061630 RepID=UPI00292F177E|nr:hypothetical protein [Bradyrhizobium sp. 33ap4]
MQTVSRRGEVVRLGPQHCYIGENGVNGERRIRIERNHGSGDVDIQISDALAAAIDRTNTGPGTENCNCSLNAAIWKPLGIASLARS